MAVESGRFLTGWPEKKRLEQQIHLGVPTPPGSQFGHTACAEPAGTCSAITQHQERMRVHTGSPREVPGSCSKSPIKGLPIAFAGAIKLRSPSWRSGVSRGPRLCWELGDSALERGVDFQTGHWPKELF